MFGCYRKQDASDPDIYAAAIAAVLSEYPADVVDYVTDPRSGLPSKSKWLPSVFEVRQACEEHALFLRRLAARRGPASPPAAPVVTLNPEETARIAKGMAELSAQLKAGIGPSSV